MKLKPQMLFKGEDLLVYRLKRASELSRAQRRQSSISGPIVAIALLIIPLLLAL